MTFLVNHISICKEFRDNLVQLLLIVDPSFDLRGMFYVSLYCLLTAWEYREYLAQLPGDVLRQATTKSNLEVV